MELHCHNVFSNYMNDSPRIPFDCGVTIEDQLYLAYEKKIDALFITNHNTLNGYKQMVAYRDNHEKLRRIKIYPAEEITINTKGHILAYGIYETIKPGMDIDHYSNIVAEKFSSDNHMISIAGSDSHVLTTFGRCINSLESENKLDAILQEMLKRKSKILKAELALKEELFEHAYYMLSASKDHLLNYILVHHPSKFSLVKWTLDSFLSKPNSKLWKILGSLGLYLSKRVSKKVNMKGHNPYVFQDRSWKTLISMSLYP